MKILVSLFHILATVGIGTTAYHVLPELWNSDVFDFVIVAAALFLCAAMQLNKAFTGQWWS